MSDADTAVASHSRPAVAYACWICGSESGSLIRKGNLPATLAAEHFKITDSAYGSTADIWECGNCTFRQTNSLTEVLQYYEGMCDEGYEGSREARSTQAQALLRTVSKFRKRGSLLDVGAGSGILVEAALEMGFDAQGIEPSGPLSAGAASRGLPVTHGLLPSETLTGPYDVVTAIDVVEHVSNPIAFLKAIRQVMQPDGVVVVVTPDVSSFMARMMGWRWWHYRIAHIGYFDRETLTAALRSANLEPIHFSRPSWYFPVDYLMERALQYFPSRLRFAPPKSLARYTVPLNLFDSLLVVAKAN